MAVTITAANVHDLHGGKKSLTRVSSFIGGCKLKKIYADGAYAAESFRLWVKKKFDALVQISKNLAQKFKAFWPKTWKEAIPLIVWGVLIFAAGFEGIAALVHAEWLSSLASFVLMVGLMAVLFHGKTWIASINPNWLVGAVIVALVVITFSPFVEQQKWQFSLEPVNEPVTIISAGCYLLGGNCGSRISSQ
jgi:hypothetical protein